MSEGINSNGNVTNERVEELQKKVKLLDNKIESLNEKFQVVSTQCEVFKFDLRRLKEDMDAYEKSQKELLNEFWKMKNQLATYGGIALVILAAVQAGVQFIIRAYS